MSLCRVQLGNLKEFMNTSCVTNLTFLTESDDSPDGKSELRIVLNITMTIYKHSQV